MSDFLYIENLYFEKRLRIFCLEERKINIKNRLKIDAIEIGSPFNV